MEAWSAEAALAFGRKVHIRGACIHVIGRREVERHRRVGVGLDACEGVQVVCGPDGAVLTAHRNRDFRGLRQQGRARRKRKASRMSGRGSAEWQSLPALVATG